MTIYGTALLSLCLMSDMIDIPLASLRFKTLQYYLTQRETIWIKRSGL